MGRLDELGDAVRRTIRAFHGSPYDFDRFDASKIGTGEGHQAYGYGHYFAQHPDVSESYRHALKGKVSLLPPAELAAEYDSARRAARSMFDAAPGGAVTNDLLDAIRKAEEAQKRLEAARSNPGHMYEVEIDIPESSLLDWDAPLSYQPHALKFFQDMSVRLPQEPPVAMLDRAIEVDGTGSHAYGRLQDALSENAGTWRMPAAHGSLVSKRLVADALREGGIPGIKYLDQQSRQWGLGDGAGTRNYVIFPGAEDSIRILRKFAVPGVVGTGAAAMSEEE